MAITTFDVDAEKVRADYFPQRNAFSGSSAPTSTRVGEFILEESAALAGRLLRKGISAADVATGVTYVTQSTWTVGYAWCRRYVALAVAIKVLSVSTQGAADTSSKWGEWLAALQADLFENGAVALGDEALDGSGSGPGGPQTHISELGLEVDDENASAAIHRLRRDDER